MSATAQKKSVLKVTGSGQYPLVPLLSIQISERPEPGQEFQKLFYNPRSLDSFTPQKMAELMESIRLDGLQQPPIVRATTSEGQRDNDIISIELIAGERRLRSLFRLFEENSDCFDDQNNCWVPAQQLYEKIPCKLLYNISDELALRLAFIENNEHQSLSIQEEVDLVERLIMRGLHQNEIVKMLSTNITWVSQTGNFRQELPPLAFEKLITGKMTRHVAVQILSYNKEDREVAFEKTLQVEKSEHEEKLLQLKDEVGEGEDLQDLAEMDLEEAERQKNVAEVKRLKKIKKAAAAKTDKALAVIAKVEAEEGVIRQGHLAKGAQIAGVVPKKAKTLTKSMIEQFFRDLPQRWIVNGKTDPVCKELYPVDFLEMIKAVSSAILTGESDLGKVIRTVLVKSGQWRLPSGFVESESELLDIESEDEELE